MPKWLQELAPAISWLIVIGGWLFVRKDNNKREDRREIRELLETILAGIKESEARASEYYRTENNEKSFVMQFDIKGTLETIEKQVERYCKMLNTGTEAKKEADKRLDKFTDIVKKDPFESKQREQLPHEHQRFLEIRIAATELSAKLEDLYAKRYFSK